MTKAMFQELLRRQQASGLTVRDFCANEGIGYSTFYYWHKKCRTQETQPKIFIPLSIEGEQLPAHEKKHHLLSHPLAKEVESPVIIELVFPNGTVLRVKNQVDLPLLQKLVHLYD